MHKHDHILMQYETPLPDDFDMEQIRVRARKLAPQFDHYSDAQLCHLPVLDAKIVAPV
jgi:hypothetical protein